MADVNTERGFTEALVMAGGGELTPEQAAKIAETPDRSVLSGITESPEGQQRDEGGRFAPEAPPAPKADEGVAPPKPAEGGQEQDPRDKQLADAQSFIGQQSETIGTLRAQNEAFEKRLAALEEGAGEEEEGGLYIPTDAESERIETMISEIGGPATIARLAAQEPHLIEDAIDIWYELDPRNARKYEREVNRLMEQAQGSEQAPAAPELPPEVQGLVARERMSAVFSRLSSELGEKGPALAPHIDAALSEAGPLTQKAIQDAFASGDEKQYEVAFHEIVRLAENRANLGATEVAQQQRKAASKEAKQAAQVATGSQRSVSSGQAGEELPRSNAEFEALKQSDPARAKRIASALVAKQFKDTETTSVRDGLTYGKEPA